MVKITYQLFWDIGRKEMFLIITLSSEENLSKWDINGLLCPPNINYMPTLARQSNCWFANGQRQSRGNSCQGKCTWKTIYLSFKLKL